jgi:hypothetical protein
MAAGIVAEELWAEVVKVAESEAPLSRRERCASIEHGSKRGGRWIDGWIDRSIDRGSEQDRHAAPADCKKL